MGLDMYLRKHKYLGANYEHNNIKGTVYLTKNEVEIPINVNQINEIIEEGLYWRKANAIHKWFVDNVQEGVDNCGYYYVSTEKLEELLKVCKEVKKDNSKAAELLPTQEGFFFGGVQYDEWYFKDIDYTIKGITELLKEQKQFEELGLYILDFQYHSSW